MENTQLHDTLKDFLTHLKALDRCIGLLTNQLDQPRTPARRPVRTPKPKRPTVH